MMRTDEERRWLNIVGDQKLAYRGEPATKDPFRAYRERTTEKEGIQAQRSSNKAKLKIATAALAQLRQHHGDGWPFGLFILATIITFLAELPPSHYSALVLQATGPAGIAALTVILAAFATAGGDLLGHLLHHSSRAATKDPHKELPLMQMIEIGVLAAAIVGLLALTFEMRLTYFEATDVTAAIPAWLSALGLTAVAIFAVIFAVVIGARSEPGPVWSKRKEIKGLEAKDKRLEIADRTVSGQVAEMRNELDLLAIPFLKQIREDARKVDLHPGVVEHEILMYFCDEASCPQYRPIAEIAPARERTGKRTGRRGRELLRHASEALTHRNGTATASP